MAKGASGGWMEASANNLLMRHNDIELAIVSTWSKITKGDVGNMRYYTIPANIYDKKESERHQSNSTEEPMRYAPDPRTITEFL